MRALAVALVLAVAAVPAVAATPVATRGDVLRDSNHVRVGRVDEVRADGSVALIVNSKPVVVSGDKLSLVDGKLTASLTKDQIAPR